MRDDLAKTLSAPYGALGLPAGFLILGNVIQWWRSVKPQTLA